MLRQFLYCPRAMRTRWLTFTALAWAVVAGALLTQPALRAQEAGAVPAAPPAAAPAAQPAAPAAAPARRQGPPTIAQKSLLRFYFEALGWFYTIVFLGHLLRLRGLGRDELPRAAPRVDRSHAVDRGL